MKEDFVDVEKELLWQSGVMVLVVLMDDEGRLC